MKSRRGMFSGGLFGVFLVFLFSSEVSSHCQVPCGIYGDEMRFEMLEEHITTMEKAMRQIGELSKDSGKNMKQIVRWVQAKDEHADEFSHIVSYYFMAQRVKPEDEKDAKAHKEYLKKLELLHKMLFYSMKAKQSTDLANVEALKSLVSDFRKAYLGEQSKGHHH